MRQEFRLSLTGDRIEVVALRDALADILKLLKAVESRVAVRGGGVRWRIATLSYASPVVFGCVGEPRSRKRDAPDHAPAVVDAVLAGFEDDLERGMRPESFDDDALETAKRLARLRGQRGVNEVLVMRANGRAPEPVALTPRTLATVDDFIGVKSESAGSVEGTLEVISSHGGITCRVYDVLTGRPVKCEVPDRLKRAVLDAFEQRVVARGIVRRDGGGQPRQIVLEDVSLSEVDEKAPFISLAGIDPDFTGGVDSAEYTKARWK